MDDPMIDAMDDDEPGAYSELNGARRIDADSILDSLVRTKGASIVAGITAGLSAGIMRQLSDVFEGDFFDF